MYLNWKTNSPTHATSELGRLFFWVSDLMLNPNKDGTHKYEIRHYTKLTNSRSNQALCIGMINAHDINEAIVLADEFIFGKKETEADKASGDKKETEADKKDKEEEIVDKILNSIIQNEIIIYVNRYLYSYSFLYKVSFL